MRLSSIALALALTVGSAGCSFLFVTPVHANSAPKETNHDCTESVAAPVIDTIVAGAGVVRTGYELIAPDSTFQGAKLSRGESVTAGLLGIALYVSSAAYGFSKTSECTELRAADQFAPPEGSEAPRVRRRRPTSNGAPPAAAVPQEKDDE